jgi:DNA-binding transcriptional LysR family regulator
MKLTDAGQAVLSPARRALREFEAIYVAKDSLENLIGGRLVIVYLQMMAPWISDLLADFHALHPRVSFTLADPQGYDHDIFDLVRRGETDLGVARFDQVPGDLVAIPVGTETGVLVVPEKHPLAARLSVDINDLREEPVIATTPRFRPYFDGLFREAGFAPTVVAETDHSESALELVRAGIGVTLARAESVQPVLGRGAVMVPFSPPLTATIAVVARGEEPLSPAGRAFFELAASRFEAFGGTSD